MSNLALTLSEFGCSLESDEVMRLWCKKMASNHVRWRQREATRAIKALEAAGLEAERLEFQTDGKMVIVPRKRGEQSPEPSDADKIVERLR